MPGKIAQFAVFALLALFGLAAQAETKPEFEVASIHENRSDEKPYSNFPLSPGPQFTPVGGNFSARNLLLLQYILFAYKPANSYQLATLRATLPDWVRSAHFDIEARAPGNPTKEEFRLMMQSLLESRFHISVHREMRDVPVFSLVLVKPGKIGPQLHPHSADDPDCSKTPPPEAAPGAYPAVCGEAASVVPATSGDMALAGRNVAVARIVVGLTNSSNNIERPILDATNLTGTYDFKLEWTPEPDGPHTTDTLGPSFIEALHDQLGMKLLSAKGPVEVLLLDHIDHLTEN
jgi:uncharacterized protein (TIGR03435 family)